MAKKLKQTKLKTIFNWLDNNILLVFAGFLLAFIPLYPKIPLFDALPGYIVRVRLEDMFVLTAAIAWLIQVIRKKNKWKTPFFWLILAYEIAAILSILSALFLIKTVPLETLHFAKTFLHFIRYIEYFSLFLIVFSSIKSIKDVKILTVVLSLTVLAAAIYGFGQKYFYWPVYSTMNREFSKGIRLYLTEHARVQSTFGGHYDLAAYLVITLSLILSMALKTESKKLKLWFHIVHLVGLWLLIVTASRSSIGAYMVGSLFVIFLLSLQQKTLKKKIVWGLKREIILILSTAIIMIGFSRDTYDRFLQTLQSFPVAWNFYHKVNDERKKAVKWVFVTTGIKETSAPSNGLSLTDLEQQVLTQTDTRPATQRPGDVYVDVPDKIQVATTSAEGVTTYTMVEVPRTWSETAYKYGLSMAIRLDTLWPQAIDGFMKNPLLGSGYATLNKEGIYHFTEADSTDNNYLRTLGETGVLGVITFYGSVLVAMMISLKFVKNKDPLVSSISVGFFGASIGLLLNATYIDVFAASKVAFTYWGLTGLVIGTYYIKDNQPILSKIKVVKQFTILETKIKLKKKSKVNNRKTKTKQK
jgi:hypothetical protein